MKKNILSFIHIILIILAYTSPFWLDWHWFSFGLALYTLQIAIFGGCVLTTSQYGKKGESFSTDFFFGILSKLGFRLDKRKLNVFLGVWLPLILIMLTVVWQLVLHFSPLIKWIYY